MASCNRPKRIQTPLLKLKDELEQFRLSLFTPEDLTFNIDCANGMLNENDGGKAQKKFKPMKLQLIGRLEVSVAKSRERLNLVAAALDKFEQSIKFEKSVRE